MSQEQKHFLSRNKNHALWYCKGFLKKYAAYRIFKTDVINNSSVYWYLLIFVIYDCLFKDKMSFCLL